jgi:PleD family two-component response regulator
MDEGLIIDDNRQTADALNQMLRMLGFKARVALGSSPAMELLGTSFTPKFICLDINMPGVDGTEILTYLKREPRLKSVPVFVITADDQPETRAKVMKLGAILMLIKPATIDGLEDAFKTVNLLA